MTVLSTLAPRLVFLTAIVTGFVSQVHAEDNKRIVSLGGSITEILYDLDMQEHIVAVDSTSVYPASVLQEKPNVGYIRALNAEGVLAVDPGLILADKSAGPKEVVDILQAATLPYVTIDAAYSAQGILDKITLIGKAIDKVEEAAKLSEKVSKELATLDSVIHGLPLEKRKKVLFILSNQDGRLMVAGTNNQANSAIEMAGGINLVQSFEGYKTIDDEALLSDPPEAIVMMTRSSHLASDEILANHVALQNSPAIKEKRIFRMDGMYLLGFGPRTVFAAADLARHLYPDNSELRGLFQKETPK